MVEPIIKGERLRGGVSASAYHQFQWRGIQKDVTSLTEYAKDMGIIAALSPHEWVQSTFQLHDPQCTIVLLRNPDKVIGFSVAYQQRDPSEAAISVSVIAPEYQHNGYIGILMNGMEGELKRKGIQKMGRYAVGEDYIAAIERHYDGRILSFSRVSPVCKYFEISL